MNSTKVLAYMVVMILLICGCSKEETEVVHMQVYNFKAVDAYDKPFAQMPITLRYNMGCTFYELDIASGVTDASGKVQLATHMHPDTISNIMERHDFDERVINQTLEYELEEGYYLHEYTQVGVDEIGVHRPQFIENEESIIRLMKKATLHVSYDYGDAEENQPFIIYFQLSGQKGATTIDKKLASTTWKGHGHDGSTFDIPGGADMHISWEIFKVVLSDNGPSTEELQSSGMIDNGNIPEGGLQELLLKL